LCFYVEVDNEKIYLDDEKSVFSFILSNLQLSPKIIGYETALQLADKEIKNMQASIQKYLGQECEDEEVSLDFSNLEDDFAQMNKVLDECSFESLPDSVKNKIKRIKRKISNYKKMLVNLEIDYKTQKDEYDKVINDFNKKVITYDTFASHRVRYIRTIKNIRTNLINIKQKLQLEIKPELQVLIRRVKKEPKK